MTVTIETTQLSFRVKAWPNAKLKEAHVDLYKYLDAFTDYYWDKRANRFMPGNRYRFYDEERHLLHLPRYDLPRFTDLLDMQSIPYTTTAILDQPGVPINYDLKIGPRDDRQVLCIDFLVKGEGGIRGIELDGGGGKTYITINALSKLGVRAMVRVGGLTDQWVARFKQFTDLTDDDIYVIKGGASIAQLLKRIDKTLFPKVIIASIGTLRSYAAHDDLYSNYPPFYELCDRLKVGITVIDEAHLNFKANLMVDLQINPSITIPLTATFDVTKPKIKTIFDNHYPLSARFGGGMAKKYVKATAYKFKTYPVPRWAYVGKEGYSHVMYENYLLKRVHVLQWIFKTVYAPIINSHYINLGAPEKKQKMLILTSTEDMCTWLETHIQDAYKDLKVGMFFSGRTPETVFEDNDIIVSTHQSSGTGRDIASLRTVLNTISIRSDPLNRQIFLRLRELPEDTPEFVYVYNEMVQPQVDHHGVRMAIYGERALSFNQFTL